MSVTTSRTDGAARHRADSSGTAQSLALTDLVKTYASRGRESVTAVKGIDLSIEPGELVALLGPSGCGKTTTLRMIAGLETVTSGSIRIGDREISQLPAAKRGIGVGFESYALYPPLSVRENLLYGLKARKVKGAEQMVASISKRLEMDDLLELRPASLSSGQKQRVALARALVRNPPVLLLDEPLSHLDASARQRVRRELKVLQREFGYTTIVVTHDQVEALSLADRLAVMDAGVVQQFGTPDEVFDDPANLFVAQFVGEPQINVLYGIVRAQDGRLRVEIGSGNDALETAATGIADGTRVSVGVRPQDCSLSTGSGPGIRCTVAYFEHLLEFGLATSTVAGVEEGRRGERSDGMGIIVQTPGTDSYEPEQEVVVSAPPERVYLFDTETGERLR
jgi:multiple sugar transport system ATP-binding protein